MGRVIWRLIQTVLAVLFLGVVGLVVWSLSGPAPTRPPRQAPLPRVAPAACASDQAFAAAAAQNAVSLTGAAWSAFGRPEAGWEIYAPLTAHEVGSDCPPDTPAFAKALATWQGAHHLAGAGVMTEETLKQLRTLWLERRPFVVAMARGCPPPPPPEQLAWVGPEEGFHGKPVQLRLAALAAYRSMVAAARAEAPEIDKDHSLLSIFSGYRDPVADGLACDTTVTCGTITRARCSAHRTGLAVDLYLGSTPDSAPEMSADPNRLFQSRSTAYRWLVANGARFGFVNYPFEPWHWEWTGEAP